MKHVGVREDEIRRPADQGAFRVGRVAVVDGRAELGQLEFADLAELVASEGLRREEVQGRPPLLLEDTPGEMQVVHERLSARGPR
jgi:hypothetical protein